MALNKPEKLGFVQRPIFLILFVTSLWIVFGRSEAAIKVEEYNHLNSLIWAHVIKLMKVTELSEYGISQSVISRLTPQTFTDLTEVQERAVKAGIFDGKNLVVSAPTNTGKTFVGELAAIVTSSKSTMNQCFMLVPLKALAEEKFEDFKEKYQEWGLKTAISTSDRVEFDNQLDQYDLVILTYEKLNSIMVRNPQLVRNIGVLIIDELQIISDPSRGPSLEIILTKIMSENNAVQIIGLSATIPNADDLAKWLDAKLVTSDKRLVELREGVINAGDKTLQFQDYMIEPGDFIYKEFNTGRIGIENSVGLHQRVNIIEKSKGEQMIIFDKTQKSVENLAIVMATRSGLRDSTISMAQDLESQVESTPSTRLLNKILFKGVAFHHAGLLSEERILIEKGFNSGKIRIIYATTTLSAGVNTPAKIVIFNSHQTWEKKNISVKDYKNMAGRAGRIQDKDGHGRSILLAYTQKELEDVWKQYVTAMPEPVHSAIKEPAAIETSILGLVYGGTYTSISSILSFIEKTFFGHTYYHSSAPEFRRQFKKSLEHSIRNLADSGFLNIENEKIVITNLGKKCAEGLLLPKTVSICYNAIKDKHHMVLDSENWNTMVEPLIHLIVCSENAFPVLLWPPRSDTEKEDLRTIYEENKSTYLYIPEDRPEIIEQIHTTRMLLRWIEGVSYNDLLQYGNAGIIKRTAETISWIMGGIASLIEKPLFDVSEKEQKMFYVLSERLLYGIPEDALEIIKLKIPGISRIRSKHLAEAGFTTVESLIQTNIENLQEVKGINMKLAHRIKKHVEEHILEKQDRVEQSHIRIASELNRNPSLLKELYTRPGDRFVRAFIEIMKEMDIEASYIGNTDTHGPDALIITDEGKIVVEGKRKENGKKVRANESEEIRGKGASFTPIVYVTLGYPDFVEEAIEASRHTKTTLIRADIIGEALIAFWKGKFTKEGMIKLLKNEAYIENLDKSINQNHS